MGAVGRERHGDGLRMVPLGDGRRTRRGREGQLAAGVPSLELTVEARGPELVFARGEARPHDGRFVCGRESNGLTAGRVDVLDGVDVREDHHVALAVDGERMERRRPLEPCGGYLEGNTLVAYDH